MANAKIRGFSELHELLIFVSPRHMLDIISKLVIYIAR